MARRNIKIDLRLNEQEMERLRRDVARSGWSREKYLRALIEHSIIKEMPSMDLVAVLRNLQQINNNINQIALVANAKGFIDTAAYWENADWLKKTIHELLEVMYGSWQSTIRPLCVRTNRNERAQTNSRLSCRISLRGMHTTTHGDVSRRLYQELKTVWQSVLESSFQAQISGAQSPHAKNCFNIC